MYKTVNWASSCHLLIHLWPCVIFHYYPFYLRSILGKTIKRFPVKSQLTPHTFLWHRPLSHKLVLLLLQQNLKYPPRLKMYPRTLHHIMRKSLTRQTLIYILTLILYQCLFQLVHFIVVDFTLAHYPIKVLLLYLVTKCECLCTRHCLVWLVCQEVYPSYCLLLLLLVYCNWLILLLVETRWNLLYHSVL